MVNSALSSQQLRNQILNTQPLDVSDPIRADRRLVQRDPSEAVRRGMSDVSVVTPKREATPPARSRPAPEPKTVDTDDSRRLDRQSRLSERFAEAAIRRNRDNDQETHLGPKPPVSHGATPLPEQPARGRRGPGARQQADVHAGVRRLGAALKIF